jgi:ATP:ADP antiporter, AAA family
MMDRVLRRLLPMRSGEFSVALLMFAYSFLAMSAWNIVRPVTRSKFIDALGSDNLPYVQLAAGVLIGVLMHFYTAAISRLPRRLVIPVTQSAIVALLVAFSFLLRSGAAWVTVTFYFVGLILGLLLISQFWTLANDLYDARQAKRLFGLIGAGSSLGGALGAQITATAVQQVGSDNLLLVAAAILGLCIVIVRAIDKRQALGATADFTGEERGVGGGEAIALLRESRHLRIIALVVGFAAAGAWIIEQQLNMAAEATRGSEGGDAIAAFLAQVNALMSLSGFVVQLTLTSRIHRSMGLAFALLLLPVSFAATAVVILVSGALWAPAVARGLDTTLRYTVDKTTRELLFLPLPAELKYRAKPFIDVTMDRVARALAALLVLVLIKPWGLALDWRGLSYASIPMTGLWIAVALVARRDYLESFRASIGDRSIVPERIRTNVGDAATIEALVEDLSNPEEEAVLYAIDMLQALDRPHLITPLLLHHESPRVRAHTLHALAAARSRIAIRWTGAIERMMQDVDVDVRAAALRALAALSEEDPSELMRRHLEDPEPRVAVAAATALARSQVADVAMAEATLQRLVADSRDAGVPGRKEVAAALSHLADPRFRPLLVPLLYDPHLEVVREAIRSARAIGASDGLFLPGLISLLGHRLLKAEARDALVGYGEAIVPALEHSARDEREHVWIRRHIPSTLAQIPTQASMDALVGCMAEQDGFLRYKAIAAIERHRREHPELRFPGAIIENLVLRETAQYYNYLTLRHNLSRHDAGRGSLLDQALGDKLARTLDRIFRLVGLLYNMEDVAAARSSIEQGAGRRRAAAVEYLDNLLKGVVRKRVLPILEDTPITEKVRVANLVVKSRPRDLDDTLAQLVHDDDPVLAATAIHFVVRCEVWSLADDLEFVRAHRSHDDRSVAEAASWALAWRDHAGAQSDGSESLPAVEVVDRLRRIPMFEFVPVDELFRIASLGRESRYLEGQELHSRGAPIEHVECLIEGAVRATDAQGQSSDHRAPSVFGLEEVLKGAPISRAVEASQPVVTFRIRAADFMTMISDNVWLTQGLFRTLSAEHDGATSPVQHPPRRAYAGSTTARTRPLQPMDQALLLRQHPLLAGATASQLLALVGAAREVPLVQGQVLFEADAVPAVYLVLEGGLLLKAPDGAAVPVVAGSTVGVAEALAGYPAGWHAVVTENGRALRLGQDELFAVLTDDLELMQGLFSGALALRASAVATASVA